MGFQTGVYGGGTGNTRERPACSAVVFATADEADRAGDELLSRWTTPSAHCVIEVDLPVNYEFPVGTPRPRPLPKVLGA